MEPGQVQQGSGECSGEGLGGFGAEPGHVNRVLEKVPEKVPGSLGAKPSQAQQGSGEGRRSGRLWCRARSGSTGFRGLGQVQQGSGEGSGEGLGQVRLNRVPEKVPEKVWDALVQSQVRFNRICGHLYNSWKPS